MNDHEHLLRGVLQISLREPEAAERAKDQADALVVDVRKAHSRALILLVAARQLALAGVDQVAELEREPVGPLRRRTRPERDEEDQRSGEESEAASVHLPLRAPQAFR